MGWFCQKSRFQYLGAKMVGNPETPGISPDTPDLEYSGENSGYRPGKSGLGSPDTPDFWGMFWARECNFCVNY